jgi:hypothetical protein
MNRLDRAPVHEFRRSRFPGRRLLLLCAVVFLSGTTARTAQGTDAARQRVRDAAPTIHAHPDSPAVVGDTLFSIDVEDIGAPPVDTQLGVEFALDYFWVTGRSSADNIKRLYKLNRSGQLVASFPQGTTTKFGWRDLAFDGTYLYASDENEFAKIDPNTGQKVGTLQKPSGVTLLRGLAFDPARRHFWTSDFSGPLVEFDSTGTIINSFETPDSSAYGLAWDQWTSGGPYLWVWAQTGPRDGPFCTAIQVNPLTGKKTGIQFTGVDFQADTLNDLAGGATISGEIDPSRTVFVGLHQSAPDRVVVYDLTLLPPGVVSLPATDIARTSVTLGGTINPNNLPATVWFEWGTNSSLTVYDSVGTQFAGSGTKSVVATTSLPGLTAATTYYYRIAGMNAKGTTRGSILSFTTIANPPVVSSQAATGITSTGTILNGGVNPNGALTTAWFEWGTNSTLTTYDTVGTHSVGSGTSSVPLTTTLTGLISNTTYYFRVVGQNAGGTQRGVILSFTTNANLPVAVTQSATGVTSGVSVMHV